MLEKKIIMATMACLTVLAEENTVLQTLKNGTTDGTTYQNPVIPGFNPDPSICNVGEDYYLVTSTFEFFPGLPVYHSKDLVNWRLIGHALSDPKHLNLDDLADNKGLFAPSIRHHNGTFYIACTMVRGKGNYLSTSTTGNFVVTATNPAGPWSEPHEISAPGIDPQLFFDDDGKVFYIGPDTKPENQLWPQHWNIWLQEIDPETWQLVGERKTILTPHEYLNNGNPQNWLNNYEGPHIYKINGIYYLLVSHGGTSWSHAVSMWKSDKPFGPYETNPNNPIVTHRDIPKKDSLINSTGHADIIQTQAGEWWMVLLGKRLFEEQKEIIGRETFLVPMSWDGDFPVVNPGPKQGRVQFSHHRPNLPTHPWPDAGPRDEFDATELHMEWNFLRTPRSTWWTLTSKPGFLQLHLRPEALSEAVNPSVLLRRQKDLHFEASMRMLFHPEAEGEAAGMTVYRGMNAYFTFLYTLHNGEPSLVVTARSKKDGVGSDKVLAAIPVDSDDLYLKVEGNDLNYSFSFSPDGRTWKPVKENAWGGILHQYSYTGAQVGLYATGNSTSTYRTAAFDWFEYQSAPPRAEKRHRKTAGQGAGGLY